MRLLALLVLLTGLVGCSEEQSVAPPPTQAEQPAALSTDAATLTRELLERRADAVMEGDRASFMRDVSTEDPAFAASQRTYFANLRQLPLAVFSYVVPDGSITATEQGVVRVRVSLTMQLDGFDAVPVETPMRFTFTREPGGELLLTAVRDPEFESEAGTVLAPWDLGPVEIETTNDVLGIFDPDSIGAAQQIMASVQQGIADVEASVPLEWSGRVVVYALSDLTVLRDLDNLPGGDPDRLDGVAFPVSAGPGSQELASTRFILHPRMIHHNDAIRDRLIRHELTHVAIGRRDDRVPTWLSEGLAEYVSVQPIAPADRMISSEALRAARDGVTGLPADETFNAEGSGANYGLSWYVCEYIASTYGEDALWRLFDEMRRGDGTDEAGQDAVLHAVLGVDSTELARGAAQKIVGTFG